MRKYTLASPKSRAVTDLKGYEETITSAVHQVIPAAKVTVEETCYYVSPTPTQGEAIRIGRLICQSKLKEHCIQIPKLFSSMELEEDRTNEPTKEKCSGGHH